MFNSRNLILREKNTYTTTEMPNVLCRYRNTGLWNINLKFKPFFLGGIMQGSGNKPPAMVPMKGNYNIEDVKRLRVHYNIPLEFPSNFAEVAFVKGTLQTGRFLTAVDMKYPELTENLSRELWMRIWNRDEDVTEPESFREAGKKAGLSDAIIEDALSRMGDKDVKDRLKQYTEEALKHGAFGSPTIIVHVNNKPEMIFGSDRFDVLAEIIGEKWYGPLPELGRPKL